MWVVFLIENTCFRHFKICIIFDCITLIKKNHLTICVNMNGTNMHITAMGKSVYTCTISSEVNIYHTGNNTVWIIHAEAKRQLTKETMHTTSNYCQRIKTCLHIHASLCNHFLWEQIIPANQIASNCSLLGWWCIAFFPDGSEWRKTCGMVVKQCSSLRPYRLGNSQSSWRLHLLPYKKTPNTFVNQSQAI